jgi:hypothetical protein
VEARSSSQQGVVLKGGAASRGGFGALTGQVQIANSATISRHR